MIFWNKQMRTKLGENTDFSKKHVIIITSREQLNVGTVHLSASNFRDNRRVVQQKFCRKLLLCSAKKFCTGRGALLFLERSGIHQKFNTSIRLTRFFASKTQNLCRGDPLVFLNTFTFSTEYFIILSQKYEYCTEYCIILSQKYCIILY